MAKMPTVEAVTAHAKRFNGNAMDNSGNGILHVEFPTVASAMAFRADAPGSWWMDIRDGDCVYSIFDSITMTIRVEEFRYFPHDVVAEIRNRIQDYETEGNSFDTMQPVGMDKNECFVYVSRDSTSKTFKITVTEI